MIELHAHTTVSDGGDSPSELVAVASGASIDTLAVTDHDNDAGCAEAQDEGIRRGVDVIRGVEISCDVEDLASYNYAPRARPTMHLLGYFVPSAPNPLSNALAELQHHRANRNMLIVERLNELGIPVTFEEVEVEAGGAGAQIGRPHFAAVLVRHGAVPDYQSAFDVYLAKGAKAYVGRKLFKPVEAIKLMLAAGSVPVFAHPFTMNLEPNDLERFVDELVRAGLKGIEGYHGDWTEAEQQVLRELGWRNKLIVSGGSDYHGHMRPDRGMPGGKHGVITPDGVVDELRDVAARLAKSAVG